MTSIHPPAWWNGPLGPLTSGRDLYGEDLRDSICPEVRRGGERPAGLVAGRRDHAEPAITRSALRAIASGAGRALSVLLVALTAHHHPTAADHRAVDSRDDAGRIGFGDLDQSMALAQVDLSDVIAGNSSFAGDRAHQIADLHTITRSDSHEETRHPARCRLGSIAIRRPRPRDWWSVLGCRAPLGSLALQQVKRGGSELRGVELLEQRLERDDLARRNTARQHRPQLLSHRFLAVMGAALGPAEIERREPSTRQLPEPGDLSGSRQYHDLNRLCLGNPLELRGRHRRLVKNHRVRGSPEIGLRYANVRVVIVIAERAQSLLRALGGCSVACHDYGRGRVQVVEQSSERGGPGAGANRDVPDDWKLVVLRHLRRFDLGGAYPPGAAGISLDQVVHSGSDFARDDDAIRLAELAEERFEGSNGLGTVVEDVVRPGEDDGFHGIDLEERSANEPAELGGGSGNGEHGTRFEDPGGAGRARDGDDFDSRRTRKAQHGLGDGEGRFRIASYDHDLSASCRGIDARQGRSQKFRNRLGRMRKGVNQILGATRLSGSALSDFLRFQHPKPLFCNVAECLPRRYRYMSCPLAATPPTKDSSIGVPMITAIVLIKAEPQRIAECATKLAGIDGVSQVYSVSGEWDLVAMIEVAEHEAIARIVTGEVTVVPGIKSTHTLTSFRAYSKKDLEQAWDIGLE